jgi:hypothetical protein
MAAVDFALLQIEESPIYEGAIGLNTTPYRVATEMLYLPVTAALLSPNPAYKDRADELRSIAGAVPKIIESYAPGGSIAENCYVHDLTWLLELAGFAGTFTAGGATVTGPEATTATGVNALNSVTMNVGSTVGFPAAGTFILAGVPTAVTYTGVTPTSFTGCGAHPATTGGEVINDNVPAGASKWVFAKRTGIVARTAQIIANYADEAVKLQENGAAVSQLALTADGALTATLLGLVLKRLAVDTTSVPTYATSANPPVRRGDLSLTWLTGSAVPGDFTLSIANPLSPVRTLSVTPPSNYPDQMEFGDAQAELTGSIPKRILSATDYDALMAATTFAAKARFKTSKVIGATTYAYTVSVSMPACQYTGGDADPVANKRRFGASFNFAAAYDEVTGKDVTITLVNDVTALGVSVGLPF